MNAPDRFRLPDIQATADARAVAIDRVGVKGVRFPIQIAGGAGEPQATVATFDMYVGLAHDVKGTHMSRFLEVLHAQAGPWTVAGLASLIQKMLARLEATTGLIQLRFPYFVSKAAPVSGVTSLMDYEVNARVEALANGAIETTLSVLVPVTSLCPCSKEISEYGAHNQRSHLVLETLVEGDVEIQELIAIAEREASCELYGLLKRPDEKYVTERAYDNPKFVEDLVRDIALALERDTRIVAYAVESENFESIHNHSAFARLACDKRNRSANAEQALFSVRF